MKYVYTALYIFSLSLLTCSAQDHQKGQVIVLLKGGKDIHTLVNKYSAFTSNPGQLRVDHALSSSMNIWLLSFNAASDENAILNALRRDHDVAAAQFNYTLEERNIPDDSLFNNQWALNNIGQSGGHFGADIDALRAWDITTGGNTANGDTIVIAIVDCGFDLSHNDLHFWKNYKEIPGNGIDDDGDGYIDDYNGWNAAGNDTVTGCAHGTTLCGVAGARGNNSVGVTGINWNVQLMPVDYINVTDANVIASYSFVYDMRRLYNITNGAKGTFVVSTNTSFGINHGKPADHLVWCAMYDSLGSVGILNAAAGPNQAINIDSLGDMPTTCPSDWLIAVTNTTDKDGLFPAAGWGAVNMDIGAPGTNVLTTIPNNLYGYEYGTSISAPHIAGAVALMWAAACDSMIADYKLHPAALASVMKEIMLSSVDTLPALEGKTVSGGRLNLYKCLLGVKNYCKRYTAVNEIQELSSFILYPNPSSGRITIDYPVSAKFAYLQVTDPPGRIVATYELNRQADSRGSGTFNIDASTFINGIYFVQLRTKNNAYSITQMLIVNH